jgi:hypothetical protein
MTRKQPVDQPCQRNLINQKAAASCPGFNETWLNIFLDQLEIKRHNKFFCLQSHQKYACVYPSSVIAWHWTDMLEIVAIEDETTEKAQTLWQQLRAVCRLCSTSE